MNESDVRDAARETASLIDQLAHVHANDTNARVRHRAQLVEALERTWLRLLSRTDEKAK